MIKIIISILSIPAVIGAWVFIENNYIDLPELPTAFTNFITDSVRLLWLFNQWFPIDTLMFWTGVVIGIELLVFVLKQFDQVRQAIVDGKPLFTFRRFK